MVIPSIERRKKMDELLKKFWIWFGVTAYDYSKKGSNAKFDKDEFFYPEFNQLISCVNDFIVKENLSNSEIESLLTILAIDNESEDVLDMMVDNLSDDMVEKIATIGVNHLQPNARWQIAVLLGRRKIHNYVYFLTILSNDVDEYVRKRAQNELSHLT